MELAGNSLFLRCEGESENYTDCSLVNLFLNTENTEGDFQHLGDLDFFFFLSILV